MISKCEFVNEFFDKWSEIGKKMGVSYNRRDHQLKHENHTDVLCSLSDVTASAMLVDPFLEEVSLARDLKTGNSRIARMLESYKLKRLLPVKNLQEKPLCDPEIEKLQTLIESHDDTCQSLNKAKSIAQKIKVRNKVSQSELGLNEKKLIVSSVNSENYNLALRQCASNSKANKTLDYLLDNREALKIDINSVGRSEKTALMYADDAQNQHATKRLEFLHRLDDSVVH
ncbi:hypothetical protein [Endozoicomonas ascidiicola]|uniref:hypothetical protein n=1 Tax=Endozoicomonas ascidiicola TaxID=1698521 RepID=UPI0012FA3DC1|nr:hypothetical protein [Endozoicomonas ascidiicola]